MKRPSCVFIFSLLFGFSLASAQMTGELPPRPTPSAAETHADGVSVPPQGFRMTDSGLPIFGSQLFQGDFRDLSFSGFNPQYQIGIGDSIQLMIWGALEEALDLTVDARGNIFIPRVGPVRVQGVRNDELNNLIAARIREVFRDNVESYANLLSTQTVKVFVSGFVEKPGLYQGFASDSPLFFLDQAGGIDPRRGSYLHVSLIREGQPIQRIDLYRFLKEGVLPLIQFRDGDVILVGPRSHTITIAGDVVNPGRFEFEGNQVSLSRMLGFASPTPRATAVSVRRARDGSASAIVVPLQEIASIDLQPGDHVEVSGRNITRDLLIRVSGEHEGVEHIVLPQGARLADALAQIKASPLSDTEAIQIFRRSVAQRQGELLRQSLDNLERSVLGATSSTLEEARLRQVEAETILSFIERARRVEPRGQIILEDLSSAASLLLEDGDLIHVPAVSQLVNVHGEVKYPNTQTYRPRETLARYIDRAGGFTGMANTRELIIIRNNGQIETVSRRSNPRIAPGDEILVLPEPDQKRLLFAREITTIIYQLALGARVVVGL